MAGLKRKEFAKLAGVSYSTVQNYLALGKLKSLPDKTIDTSDPVNDLFLRERKAKELLQSATNASREKEKTEPDSTSEDEDLDNTKVSYSFRKQKADALKAEAEAELKNLQVDKLMGNLMPVELVHQIVKINIQGIFRSFESDLIKIAAIYCDTLAGGDRGKLSEITKKMRDHLVRTIEKTKENTNQEVNAAIEQYAETRGRGERK